jgi:hypothetical protein
MSKDTRKVLASRCFDGTEVHHIVDQELPGLENQAAAINIKNAIKATYHDAVPLDIVVEQIGEYFDLGFK